jgi:TolA-binding protein
MDKIEKIEAKIDELRSKKKQLENEMKNRKDTSDIEKEINYLEEKIEKRKELIKAVIKNVETNVAYVNREEQAKESGFIAQVVQPTPSFGGFGLGSTTAQRRSGWFV